MPLYNLNPPYNKQMNPKKYLNILSMPIICSRFNLSAANIIKDIPNNMIAMVILRTRWILLKDLNCRFLYSFSIVKATKIMRLMYFTHPEQKLLVKNNKQTRFYHSECLVSNVAFYELPS